MTKTRPKPLPKDVMAKCRAALEFYSFTPSRKYPLPVKPNRKGVMTTYKRGLKEWGPIIGISASYLGRLLNNYEQYMLADPKPFFEIVAKRLTEIAEVEVTLDQIMDVEG